jgi:hypothetical protein
MKINRPALPVALLIVPVLALAGCSGSPPQPAPAPRGGTAAPAPRPLPQPAPRPMPARQSPAPRADAANWRDLPQTPGSWTYSAESTGSAVRFGQPGAAPLLVLHCDRSRPAIVLERPGFGASQVPATITTSAALRRLTAAPAAAPGTVQNAAIPFEITFAVRDPLLDAIAFSRGRFVFEMGGAQTLVLPAWSELGRLIEDCR